ncbi:MAG: flavin-dependent dehydrogenase [Leptolyngbyaceae cyanobacterium CSU_1_3]|nr:flavin-dependent dehydrogenase [Leptolyngbyaceae cyanobacterium CSU_1_3]
MKEILYLEIPTPDVDLVKAWLQQGYQPTIGEKIITPEGFRLRFGGGSASSDTAAHLPNPELSPERFAELSVFVWSLQRTTYLKVFRWAKAAIAHEQRFLRHFVPAIRTRFPERYPEPPQVDLSKQSIFEALAVAYPQTVHYFQKMPNGEYDLTRVYWWEQRWREGVKNPQAPKQVLFRDSSHSTPPQFDLIYVGGALGIIHAAVMARLGYRVLLMERLPFGRMNREWNISRSEFQSLIDLGLFTPAEFDRVIAREYVDGFHKFFDANNPPQAKAGVLHTPTVLNVAIDSEKLLRLCGEKLRECGGEIWEETEFLKANISAEQVTISTKHLPTQTEGSVTGRLLVDAMGTASPIAWQLNGGRAFDSVCPTVGAVIADGFEPGVWDANYGDVLNSHGDISRGRQLIWELFPGEGKDLTFYLFHYHQVHPENPGSLLEMYEDFFTILPEYRRCDMEKLVWRKPTFGYIPGHFSVGSQDRQVSFDRLIAIGDAASLQSPLVFTGFGSLVRNLSRLTHLLDTALKHDLLTANHLDRIHAYQSNVSVTWLFSKGMMVPTGRSLPPERINAMLNTFFDVLATQPPAIADAFIKDRVTWTRFNGMAIVAALKNPSLLLWIWEMAGAKDIGRWLGNYFNFGWNALLSWLLAGWFPGVLMGLQPWLEKRFPALWLGLLSQAYAMTYGMGKSQAMPRPPVRGDRPQPDRPASEKQVVNL